MAHNYLHEVSKETCSFLGRLDIFSRDAKIYNFSMGANEKLTRKTANGFFTLKIQYKDRSIGVIYNDFRINGGSFDKQSSLRIIEFFHYMRKNNLPIVFIVNSMGVRIMEGRGVFQNAFGIIPALLKFKEKNVLITGSIGQTLGLGALIFRLGHYRYALKNKALINLTGPDVLKLFFGQNLDFEKIASSEKLFNTSDMITDLCLTRDEMFSKMKKLAKFVANEDTNYDHPQNDFPDPTTFHKDNSNEKVREILNSIGAEWIEVYAQLDKKVRTFLVKRMGAMLGVFVNPPENTDNMITSKTLERYSESLEFFQALKLPIISLLDTPGADPREAFSGNKDIVPMLCKVGAQIVYYPYEKMGIVINRCYGGASILTLPKIFGAKYSFALKNAKFGIMNEKIVDQLFKNSKNFLAQWEETKKTLKEDGGDLIESGIIDEIISHQEVTSKIDTFILDTLIGRLESGVNQKLNEITDQEYEKEIDEILKNQKIILKYKPENNQRIVNY